jgi:conjugal transfer ATP-binding protein TraC
VSLASVQARRVGVEAIDDGVVRVAGRRLRAVLEVEAVNFALQGETEREAILAGFAAFLNALDHPIQIVVRVLPVDVARYVDDLEARARRLSTGMAALAGEHVAFVRRLARTRTLLERRFYVVVPAQDAPVRRRRCWPLGRRSDPTVDDAPRRRQLVVRCEEVARQLARCGLSVRRLGSTDLAQLYHACWCPELARVQRLRLALDEYTRLCVSAERVRAPVGAVDRVRRALAGERGLSEDERRFLRGTRSVADLIAPAAFEVARDHVRLDHQYARALAVTAYPRTVAAGWLAPLIDFEEPLELSIHVHPLEPGRISRTLTKKMVQLDSSRRLADRDGKLADPEREVAYEDAERVRDALQRGEERVFSVGIYALVRAGSIAALDDLTRRVELTLDGMLAHSRVALYEQDAAFRTCLPEGLDQLLVYRDLDTSSLATLFPFASASLSMETGVLYGIARHNHSPVIVDPFDGSLENGNAVVFATSGAGKSYFTKLMAVRNLLTGVEFLIVDPEDEYRALCAAVDGQRVQLASSSDERLNPFDFAPASPDESEGRDALREQVAALVSLLDLMLAEPGQPLGAAEKAVLDGAIRAVYAEAGVTAASGAGGETAPLMGDLHRALGALPGEMARSLAARLDRFVEGSLGGLFAGPTSVALDRSLVVFNLQRLEAELRPVATHMIASFVWNQVRRQRRPRMLVVDEAWSLVQHPAGAAFLAGLARRARKYYLGLVTVTQDVGDFLSREEGRTVLGNAAIKLLMKQDSTTIEPVVAAFRLSAEERQLLLGAGKGEGLLFARGTRVALRVEASPKEHKIATTAPRELAAMAAAGGAP